MYLLDTNILSELVRRIPNPRCQPMCLYAAAGTNSFQFRLT